MDYDTWKTTDFEAEAADKADEAREQMQMELSGDLFDAYVLGNSDVIDEVDDSLTDTDTAENLLNKLRVAMGKECDKLPSKRGSDVHAAYQQVISAVCDDIASGYDTVDEVERFRREMGL